MDIFSRSFVRKRVISIATTASVAAMSLALGPTRTHHIRATMPIQYVSDRPQESDETQFLAESNAATDKMMADMTVRSTGDVDRDFVAMMAPHHQGAIDIAQAVLRYGHNQQIRRLAQEIIVTQQQGIAAMRLAIGSGCRHSMPSSRNGISGSTSG